VTILLVVDEGDLVMDDVTDVVERVIVSEIDVVTLLVEAVPVDVVVAVFVRLVLLVAESVSVRVALLVVVVVVWDVDVRSVLLVVPV
jgi:hypothetical protein